MHNLMLFKPQVRSAIEDISLYMTHFPSLPDQCTVERAFIILGAKMGAWLDNGHLFHLTVTRCCNVLLNHSMCNLACLPRSLNILCICWNLLVQRELDCPDSQVHHVQEAKMNTFLSLSLYSHLDMDGRVMAWDCPDWDVSKLDCLSRLHFCTSRN